MYIVDYFGLFWFSLDYFGIFLFRLQIYLDLLGIFWNFFGNVLYNFLLLKKQFISFKLFGIFWTFCSRLNPLTVRQQLWRNRVKITLFGASHSGQNVQFCLLWPPKRVWVQNFRSQTLICHRLLVSFLPGTWLECPYFSNFFDKSDHTIKCLKIWFAKKNLKQKNSTSGWFRMSI